MLKQLRRKNYIKKKGQQSLIPTPQEMAKISLLEISNNEIQEEEAKELYENSTALTSSANTFVQKPALKKIRVRPPISRSADHRISVTEKLTESFKNSFKPRIPDLQSPSVCILSRKQPVNLSSFLLVSKGQPTSEQNILHKPRPSLNARAYRKLSPETVRQSRKPPSSSKIQNYIFTKYEKYLQQTDQFFASP